MKLLSFTDELGIGGSQVNAIELADALRKLHGFDIVLFGNTGPMVQLITEKGLRYYPAPQPGFLPSPARMRALREAVRRERPDVIHVWDWWQCLDAFYGVHLPWRIPMIATVMEMSVPTLLPKYVPTTFGTPALVAEARRGGRRPSHLLLPPVDVQHNAPGTVNPPAFVAGQPMRDKEIKIVTVSRLATHLKGQSLQRTVEAVSQLAVTRPITLFIVGDGPERPALERRAAELTEAGLPCIRLVGPMLDPRPAYAAADIVIGMGGSALRAMAFRKPVIVVGENGFSACFTPETADFFYQNGMWGIGDGDPNNTALVHNIRSFVERPHDFPALGDFGREFVVKHFSLEAVSAHFADVCRVTASRRPSVHLGAMDAIRTAAIYMRQRRFTWRWTPQPMPATAPVAQ